MSSTNQKSTIGKRVREKNNIKNNNGKPYIGTKGMIVSMEKNIAEYIGVHPRLIPIFEIEFKFVTGSIGINSFYEEAQNNISVECSMFEYFFITIKKNQDRIDENLIPNNGYFIHLVNRIIDEIPEVYQSTRLIHTEPNKFTISVVP